MSKITVTGQLTLTGGQLTAKETPVIPVGPQLWAWGRGGFGTVGDSTNINRSSPVQIGALVDWSSVASGYLHSHAIKTDGTLWSWGRNNNGMLGLENTSNYSSPTQVGALVDWSSVSGGRFHSHAIKTDGTLWSIGQAQIYGQIGDGTNVNKSSPVQVGSLTTWASVSAGWYHSLAIRTDGKLFAWGRAAGNNHGSLGDGTKINKSSPVQIGSLTTWASISAGQHSLAIKTDGTLWGWGSNYQGHLGLGDVIQRSSPVQIGNLNDWAIVSAGVQHSIAIKTDGSLWAWGKNSGGANRIGDGTSIDRSSPVQIGFLTDWSSISAKDRHTQAIKTDGTLWAWGNGNTYGQLGDGTTATRVSPVQVGSDIDWTSVSAGGRQALAIKTTT